MPFAQLLQKTLAAHAFVSAASSETVNISGVTKLAVQVAATVSTPANKAFATTDVDATANTITETAHGYLTGLKVQFTTTTTLPAGLSLATDYFIIAIDADTYKVATSLALALAGTAVDITDQGTGTHTAAVTSIAGGTAKLQKSLDGTNWFDEGSAQNITATTVLYFEKTDPTGWYYKILYAITAGQITATELFVGKGEF